MRALGNQLISKYIAHMRSIVSALESYTVPSFGAISDELLVYKTAIKIPGVDAHQEESLSLRKKIGTLIGICLDRLKRFEPEAMKSFLDGDNKLHETTDNFAHLTNLILISSEHVKSTGTLFLDAPAIPNNFLNNIQDLTHFLQFSVQATNESRGNEYVKAVNLWDKALSLRSVDKRLREKAQLHQSKAIQAAVDQALDIAKDMAGQKRFAEALNELENVRSSVQINKEQEREIVSLKQTTQTKGQHYVLKLAKKLKSGRKHMKSLRTIDMAKAIGMNDELTVFFNKLKKNFDWRQIETLEDTAYFVNCSLPELVNFMKFPNRAASNTYCACRISFSNQIDKDGYFGYLEDDIEYPVYVSMISPSLKGATLLNKQGFCVFRINGTKDLVNRLTNATVTVPYLEVIFMQ